MNDGQMDSEYQRIYDENVTEHKKWMARRGDHGPIPSEYLRHIGRMAAESVRDNAKLRNANV